MLMDQTISIAVLLFWTFPKILKIFLFKMSDVRKQNSNIHVYTDEKRILYSPPVCKVELTV